MFGMITGLGADTWEVRRGRGGLWRPQEAWWGEREAAASVLLQG